jgi:hypothetical protein
MLLASYTSGLTGSAGRQVRYSLPESVEQANEIAVTVNKAELQERRNEAFYIREEANTSDGPSRGHHSDASARNASQHGKAGRTHTKPRRTH